MRRFLVITLGLSYLILPAAASAQTFNHTITVYATVPEQRAIYLDQYGAVVKIAGNTTNNILPRIYDSSNHEVAISPAIQNQYDDFLKQHGGKLQAGATYRINPVKVSSVVESQDISVDLSGLRLGSG